MEDWKATEESAARRKRAAMTEVAVDRAGIWDAEALSDVAAATFPLACPPTTTPDDIAAFVDTALSADRFGEYLTDPTHVVLKATDGDAIVGYTMLVEREPTDPRVLAVMLRPALEISKMYVLPGHHGAGISTALMAAAVDHARSRRCLGVWLGVNQHNVRAQGFYRKHGFDTVGVRTFRVGARVEDDYVMQKVLG
jgi:ribosomal protein S18 acetylase RimI-like enzyme